MFKRLLTAITVIALAALSLVTSFVAPVHAYPPGCATVTTDASSYAPGATITVTATGNPADAGSIVTFTITLENGVFTSMVVTAVANAQGVAVVTITAPTTVGSYLVTITNLTCSDVSSSFIVGDPTTTTTTVPGFPPSGSVPGNGIPRTGSDTEPWLVAATSLLAIGLMLWVVTRRRRHSSSTA